MSPAFPIKKCTEADIPVLEPYAETGYFAEAYKEQVDNKRIIFIAYNDAGILAGYVHLNRFPVYAPFRRLGIPEIQDLYVVPQFRRLGLGKDLIAACEQQVIAEKGSEIGIGVGVSGKFGAAQRLYTRLGYLPDGAGVVFERESISEGGVKPLDDRMCLMMLKDLG